MATRIYAVGPAGHVEDVKEAVGPTTTCAPIAVVIDLTTTLVTGAGGTARGVSRAEVLQSLQALSQAILNDSQWPPA